MNYPKRIIKILSLFILLLLFTSLTSCDMGSIKEDADGAITYEGIKYISTGETLYISFDTSCTEIGYMKKSLIFPGMSIYKLENDSFIVGGRSDADGPFDAVWIREDLVYPADDAIISSIYLDDYPNNNFVAEIGSVTFNEIFTECDQPSDKRYEMYFCLAYYLEEIDTTIIKSAHYMCDNFGNFYISRGFYDDEGYYKTKCYLLDEAVAKEIRKLFS